VKISKPFGTIFGLLALVTILSMTQAFGQTLSDVTISTGAGTSANASCVTLKNCYSPNPLTVASGTTVIWTNADKLSHTVTSGKVSDANAGSAFDSSLVKPGGSFQFTFIGAGTFDYFCSVHPWMTGKVIVENSLMKGTMGSPMLLAANSTSSSIGSLTGPNTTSTEAVAPSVNATTAPSSSPQSTAESQSTTSTPTYTAAGPSTSPTTASSINSSTMDTSGAQMAAWAAGIIIFSIVTGIGIWTAVRRR
jgi:plastocyanin